MPDNIDPETLSKIKKNLNALIREGLIDYSVNEIGEFVFWLTPIGEAEWAKHQEH